MKFYIHTLGCKVNAYESEVMANNLKKSGFKLASDNELADIYIINTCTVTNNASNKSKKMINHYKKLNKDAIIVVCGCFSQFIKGKIDGVDIVIGNKDKSKIVSLINELVDENKKINKIYDMKNEKFEDMYLDNFESKTRAFVKIQDGCNNFCSYCIIPYVRGNIRSKDINKVYDEINTLVNMGHKEIVLTGIHTGHYGKDINSNLTALLKKISDIKNLKRIRISSIEITELDNEFLDELKNNKLIVDHMHIPLQAGSDSILKKMNRKYDTKYFYDKIKEIRSIRPDISITTDIIVGFPGETIEEFNETVEFAKKIKFTKIHVFPFSSREGTPAASMPNQLTNDEKKRRVHILAQVSNDLEIEYRNKFIGRKMEVLFENKKDDYFIGHTSNYLEVKIKSDENLKNKLIEVEII